VPGEEIDSTSTELPVTLIEPVVACAEGAAENCASSRALRPSATNGAGRIHDRSRGVERMPIPL